MTVATSGSTGSPRLCIHNVADLLDEAVFLAAQFTGRRRVVALVPAHHLYGIIWTALLPDALGVPVVVRTIGAPLGLTAGELGRGSQREYRCGSADGRVSAAGRYLRLVRNQRHCDARRAGERI
jgi:hypothetical protein